MMTRGRGRPYVYPTVVILRCYVVRIWFRIPSNNCLHHYFSINGTYNRKVMKPCGLDTLPDRRTFDRRFKVLPVGSMIGTMGKQFVIDDMIDTSIVSVDSSMIRARNGHVWHKKQIASGYLPRSGIDTDAKWGFSKNSIVRRSDLYLATEGDYEIRYEGGDILISQVEFKDDNFSLRQIGLVS